jgi:hypothetical protein
MGKVQKIEMRFVYVGEAIQDAQGCAAKTDRWCELNDNVIINVYIIKE